MVDLHIDDVTPHGLVVQYLSDEVREPGSNPVGIRPLFPFRFINSLIVLINILKYCDPFSIVTASKSYCDVLLSYCPNLTTQQAIIENAYRSFFNEASVMRLTGPRRRGGALTQEVAPIPSLTRVHLKA